MNVKIKQGHLKYLLIFIYKFAKVGSQIAGQTYLCWTRSICGDSTVGSPKVLLVHKKLIKIHDNR